MSKGTRITKRWIDADGIMRACFSSFARTNNKAYYEIVNLIEAVPAADVVEVVRCKECKHTDLFYPYCTIWEAAIDEDGYCYKGEKE